MRFVLKVSVFAERFRFCVYVQDDGKIYFVKVKNFAVFFALALVLVVGGCSDSDSISDSLKIQDYLESRGLKNFLLVRSKGQSVLLGTLDSAAPVKERPEMKSHFDYDFLMGKHEVTCKEMGRDCADSLPVTDVTLFDAILHCNRRSVAEGFDTAYSYTSAKFDQNGSCFGIEGLVFHPDVNAYRLPTEAEWMYVASMDWNPEDGWFAENSGYEPHPVCSSKVRTDGICDMAGNVTEWVYDLKVPFRKKEVSNFVGGKVVGKLDERILKGGSFRNKLSSVHLYSRGDVYTVTSSTKSDYLGFRLAFGAISNPSYLDLQGDDNVIGYTLLVNSKTVNNFIGKDHSKLVFKDGVSEHMVYVHFDNAVQKVDDVRMDSFYHPEISPDGKFVAYSTGMEGISGAYNVNVRRLDSSGAELVLSVASAAIPRWRVLENGDTVVVYVTDPGNNKNSSEFLKRETWQVPFSGEKSYGRFGKPEKLFDGAYHGGVSQDNRLAVTGSTLLRALVNGKDDIWYGGNQACNVSLSRGGAKRTLFLDFGGKPGRDFVGASYGTHERVLIADSLGNLVATVPAPAGYSFDHTEWISGSDSVFIASLSDVNGSRRKIVLVKAYTGEMLPIVDGEDLWHPTLWAENRSVGEFSWNYDSLGIYVAEHGQFSHYMGQKITLLWKYRDSAEVVALGNSHMLAGVKAKSLSLFGINLGTVPCDLHCIQYLFYTYVSLHVKNLKYLVIGLDFDLWNEFGNMGCINENFGDALGFQYDISHHFWPDGVDDFFVNRVEEIADADEENSFIRKRRGWVSGACVSDWGSEGKGHVDIVEDSTGNNDSSHYESNYEELERILDLAKKKNVTVIGIIFPVSPYYRNTGSYSRHGMRRSVAEMLIQRVKKLAEENENFVLMDENKMGNHDYLGAVASDYDHLCSTGADKLTLRLDSLLKTLEKR